MNLQQYNEEVNARLINQIKRNIDRDRRIQDGSYFTRSVKRAGLENERRVLADYSHQPSMYGEYYEGKYDPLTRAIEDDFGYKNSRRKNIAGGKFNLVNSIKDIGHKLGEPYSKLTGPIGVDLNPFDAGYKLGQDVISPYVVDPIKNSIKKGGKLHYYDSDLDEPRTTLRAGKFNLGKTLGKTFGKVGNKILDAGINKLGDIAVKKISQYGTTAVEDGMEGAGIHKTTKQKKPNKKKITKKQQEINLALKILKKHKQI